MAVTILPVAINPSETPAPAPVATSTPATGSAPATTLSQGQLDLYVEQAANAGAAVAEAHGTGNDIQDAVISSLQGDVGLNGFTEADVQAAQAGDQIQGTVDWGNGAPATQGWYQNTLAAIEAALPTQTTSTTTSTASNLPAPPAPLISTNVTNTQGAAPTTSTSTTSSSLPTAAAPTSTLTTTGTPATPTSTTTGTLASELPSLLSTILASSGSGGMGSTAAGGSVTTPSDQAALEAAAPVFQGAPAPATTSNPMGEIVGIVVLIVAVIGGFWLYHRWKTKHAAGASAPAPTSSGPPGDR